MNSPPFFSFPASKESFSHLAGGGLCSCPMMLPFESSLWTFLFPLGLTIWQQKAGKLTFFSAFYSSILSLRQWGLACPAACMWGRTTWAGNSATSKMLPSIELHFPAIRFQSSLHLPPHRFHGLFYIICWLSSLSYFKLREGRNCTFIFNIWHVVIF